MEALLSQTGSDRFEEQKWMKMIVLSLLFHAALFSSIWFVPESVPTRRMRDVVYEVNLVDNPVERRDVRESGTRIKDNKKLTIPSKALASKRIGQSKMEEKKFVIAKRTVHVKAEKIKPPEVSSAKLLDQVMPKIKTPVKEEDQGIPDEAVSRITPKPEDNVGTGPSGIRSVDGISMEIYKADIKGLIQRHHIPFSGLSGNHFHDPIPIADDLVAAVPHTGQIFHFFCILLGDIRLVHN